MRWRELFADLESAFAEAERADLAAEVADRTRTEYAALHLVDRLRAAVGRPVQLAVTGYGVLHAVLDEVGPDWMLLVEDGGRQSLVVTRAVEGVAGLTPRSAAPGSEGVVADRRDVRHALRGLARNRTPVVVTVVSGAALTGTLDRVGADFVELAEHAVGEQRRAADVRGVRVIPLSALAVLRSV